MSAGDVIIAVDAMGGDNAPREVVSGSIEALNAYTESQIFLVGNESLIEEELVRQKGDHGFDRSLYRNRLHIINATEVITNDEPPTKAFRRKKDSSTTVGLKLLKDGNASAFVSGGSTGALLTGASIMLDRVPGILRPALATMLPTQKKHVLLLDSGANIDAKPEYLLQFALMGAVYMENAENIVSPRVGLINIGAEAEKGNALTKAAYELLSNAPYINFVGNVEPRDILNGDCDVLVCDGFVGNVILKYSEGFASALFGMLKKELLTDSISKIGAALSKSAFKRLKQTFDYEEIGGAPFLGLRQVVIKAHGSSGSKAFKNAIGQAIRFTQSGVAEALGVALGKSDSSSNRS